MDAMLLFNIAKYMFDIGALIPAAIKTVDEMKPYAADLYNRLRDPNRGDPTQEEWNALHAANSARIAHILALAAPAGNLPVD